MTLLRHLVCLVIALVASAHAHAETSPTAALAADASVCPSSPNPTSRAKSVATACLTSPAQPWVSVPTPRTDQADAQRELGRVLPDQVVVRFRPSEAARLHARMVRDQAA